MEKELAELRLLLAEITDLYNTASQEVAVPANVRQRLFHCLNLDEYLES